VQLVVTFNLKTSQSEAVYKAFKAIREGSQYAGLTAAQKRIVENEIRDAQLSGVALEGEKKARFNEIQQELAKLSTTFSNNVLDSTKAFTVRLTDKADVAGLPASALGLASQTAVSKGDKDSTPDNGPWVFTLDAPSFLPVQQHAKNRELRETMYEQYITRASEKTEAKETTTGEIVGAVKEGQVGKRQGLGMLFKRLGQKLGMGSKKSLDNTVRRRRARSCLCLVYVCVARWLGSHAFSIRCVSPSSTRSLRSSTSVRSCSASVTTLT
jgi:hypothetical protein